ncbi:MerR family transcriptional regulator [Streptomyces sp. NPDC006691]|uniref:MerR family transcriptional regulator n=1 Tax=Streptomyces sp. NPDC006691 TaxID=3364757 RepID=UPI00368C8AB7
MLTIGQLAQQAGVSTKAIRVYHAKGLLPEPDRDASGYRRYDARAIIDLTRIVTLAQAGVPLARVRDVLDADADRAAEELDRIDAELRTRIRQLQQRRTRLRQLDQPDRLCLPPEAVEFMDRLRAIGLSERHEHAIRDGFILGHALAPDLTRALLPSRTALLGDDEYVAVLRGYDAALDWSPDDPRLHGLADAVTRLALRMTMFSDLPGFDRVPPETVDLLTGHLGIDSPAWARLDQLITRRLAIAAEVPVTATEGHTTGTEVRPAATEGRPARTNRRRARPSVSGSPRRGRGRRP